MYLRAFERERAIVELVLELASLVIDAVILDDGCDETKAVIVRGSAALSALIQVSKMGIGVH